MISRHVVNLTVLLVLTLGTVPVTLAQELGIQLADSSKKYQRLQPSTGNSRDQGRGGSSSKRGNRSSSQQWRRSKSDRHDNSYYRQKGYRLDNRYHHNHYYPPLGLSLSLISRPYKRLYYRGSDYFFDVSGVWYTRSGASFRVVMPPIGIAVPLLPTEYTTVWVDSTPYYYAGGVYFAWRPSVAGYVVVPAPNEQRVILQSDAAEELFIYPRMGQSEEQQANDRYECHRWGVGQTGFDPTQPAGGVSPDRHSESEANYRRAMRACLEGHDYSVR